MKEFMSCFKFVFLRCRFCNWIRCWMIAACWAILLVEDINERIQKTICFKYNVKNKNRETFFRHMACMCSYHSPIAVGPVVGLGQFKHAWFVQCSHLLEFVRKSCEFAYSYRRSRLVSIGCVVNVKLTISFVIGMKD